MRLKNALAEIEYGQAPGNFEHVIVNDDLEVAFAQLCAAIGLRPPVNNRALIFVKPHAVNPKVGRSGPRRKAECVTILCDGSASFVPCVCWQWPATVRWVTYLLGAEMPVS